MSSKSSATSKRHGALWLIAAAACALLFASGLPRLARIVPWSWEERLSHHLGGPPETLCGDFNSPAREVQAALLARLYPLDARDREFPITLEILHGPTVNAFATLGGHLYLYEGLLRQARSADEIAGILAHEISHVRERHIMQGLLNHLFTYFFLSGPQTLHSLIGLHFSRAQEADADRLGLVRLRQARIDATPLLEFFEREAAEHSMPALLSDHPSDQGRADRIHAATGYATTPALNPSEWKTFRGICGAR